MRKRTKLGVLYIADGVVRFMLQAGRQAAPILVVMNSELFCILIINKYIPQFVKGLLIDSLQDRPLIYRENYGVLL